MIMNIDTLEKEIVRVLNKNSKMNWWLYYEYKGKLLHSPNKEFLNVKKFVKKLFKDYKEGN